MDCNNFMSSTKQTCDIAWDLEYFELHDSNADFNLVDPVILSQDINFELHDSNVVT